MGVVVDNYDSNDFITYMIMTYNTEAVSYTHLDVYKRQVSTPCDKKFIL